VPEKDMFREALSRVFYRKIKRLKKKAGGGGAEEEDEEDDDDDDDMGEEDEEDEGDEGEEACPAGCEQALYERVLDLRERRLDEEDAAAEVAKAADGLRRERELLSKKQRLVDTAVAAINAEVLEYQKEKQARLNTVEIAVNVRLRQVHLLTPDERVPADAAAGLLFQRAALGRLQARISELDDERAELRARARELHREHGQLQRDKREKLQRLADLQSRCRELQLLRFGQVVDLRLLDTIGARTGTEELRAALAAEEARQRAELEALDQQLADVKGRLTDATRANTVALNGVTEVNRNARRLQMTLADTQKAMFVDPIAQKKVETAERDALVAAINEQAVEIDGLRRRIAGMRRKDVPLAALTGRTGSLRGAAAAAVGE